MTVRVTTGSIPTCSRPARVLACSCTPRFRRAQLTFVYNGDRVGVSDEGTRALAAGLRSLRRLNLSWHRNLGDAAAGALATMTALTHLDLGYCDKVWRRPRVAGGKPPRRICYEHSENESALPAIMAALTHLDMEHCDKVKEDGKTLSFQH